MANLTNLKKKESPAVEEEVATVLEQIVKKVTDTPVEEVVAPVEEVVAPVEEEVKAEEEIKIQGGSNRVPTFFSLYHGGYRI